MKTSLVIFSFLFFNDNCFAQKEKHCDVMLLTPNTTPVHCGVIAFCEKMKFKIINKSNRQTDTVIFFVCCPADFGHDFWIVNRTYHISFQEDLSPALAFGSVVDNLSERDRKYKVKGVISTAKKY